MRRFFGTTFYSSLLFSKAPGTSSSLAIFLLLLILPEFSAEVKLMVLALTAVAHTICFPYFEKTTGNSDPAIYTLDETFAMILLNIPFHERIDFSCAFILFRFFDIVKPFGIKKFERSTWISSLLRNIGDDVIAAFYSFLVLSLILYVF